MRLLDTEPKTKEELLEELRRIEVPIDEYSIAVEGLVFNNDSQWIMMHRGGKARDEIDKLEGIGGRFENEPTFREALLREIKEEVGGDADIRIVGFLEVKHDTVTKIEEGVERKKHWIVVSYLCKHMGGTLKIMEPHKCIDFVYIDELDVDPSRLSSSAQKSLKTLREKWSSVKKSLDSFC